MNILISAAFLAVRVGEYVKADTENGEFIFDTSSDKFLAKATLGEIADANEIELPNPKNNSAKKLTSALEKAFGKMKLPEQNEKTDSEKVADIIVAGVAAGLDHEDMIVKIIQEAKIKFKPAGKMFYAYMTEHGHLISAKKRNEQCEKIMTKKDFKPKDWDDVKKMAEKLCEKVSDTENSQAIKRIRSFCKEQEIEMPKPPKKSRGSFKTKVQNFVLENPLCTKKEFDKFIESQDKDQKVADRQWTTVEFAQRVAAATIALSDQDSDSEENQEG